MRITGACWPAILVEAHQAPGLVKKPVSSTRRQRRMPGVVCCLAKPSVNPELGVSEDFQWAVIAVDIFPNYDSSGSLMAHLYPRNEDSF